MVRKYFFLAFAILLPLMMLSSVHLVLAKTSDLSKNEMQPQASIDIDKHSWQYVPRASQQQNSFLITQQQALTPPIYGPATLLLEDQAGLVTELLSAYPDGGFSFFYILPEGNTYYLWLGSVRQSGTAFDSIEQRFESQDGLLWHNRIDTNLAQSDPFWKFLLGIRHVVKDGTLYEGWEPYFYEVISGWWATGVRYVTSPDGINWTVVNQPIMQTASFPSIIKEGSTYHLWAYPDVDANFDPDKRMRYRTSNSGGSGWGHWKTDGVIVDLDGGFLEWPTPSRVRQAADGTYQLFYQQGVGINLATSTNGITFTTQITDFVNFAEVLSISDTSNLTSGEFLVIDVQGEDWVYFTYSNGGGPQIAVTRPLSPPDLSLTKMVSPTTVIPGDTVTYTLTYSNAGQTTATGVVISDIIPSILTNITFQSSGATITPTGGLSYSWQVEDLAENQGGLITITGQISAAFTGSSHVTNTATITGAVAELYLANNTAAAGLTVNSAQLTLNKMVTPATDVTYHDAVTYSLVLRNSGNGNAKDVLLTDTLPISTTFARWIIQPDGANEANNQIAWTGAVSANQAITVTFVATHTGDYGETVTNIAQYAHSGDSSSAEAAFTVEPEVTPPPPPPMPNISINNVTVTEGDVATASFVDQSVTTEAIFKVTLTISNPLTVTVAYATADNTATMADDYIATTGSLTFTPGVTEAMIAIGIKGDTIVEADESFLVNLSQAVNGIIVDAQGIGTITNDDVAPTPTPTPPNPDIDDVTPTPTSISTNSDTDNNDDDDDDGSSSSLPPATPTSASLAVASSSNSSNESLPVSALPETGLVSSPDALSWWSLLIPFVLGCVTAFLFLYSRSQAKR